jgi:hypothetical protein
MSIAIKTCARGRRCLAIVAGLLLSLTPGLAAAAEQPCAGARVPDLVTVVPQHLNLVNEHQREVVRFSGAIANIGDGPMRMRPEYPLDTADAGAKQAAIQELLTSENSSGAIACEQVVSQFEFHADHNHWHISAVSLDEIRVGAPNGPVLVNDRGESISYKTTFCLIDYVKLVGNSSNGNDTTRAYWDCYGDHQGISVGWADQYHHSTPGQELDITGAQPGLYFLVSTANPNRTFIEKSHDNNTAWQAFYLSRDSSGNPKIKLVGHSECAPGSGLCGEQTENR